MNISKNEILLKGMKLLDLLLLVTSFGLSAWIAQYQIDQVPFEELVTMRMKIQNFILFMSIGGAWLWVFSSFGLYQSIHNLKRKYQSLGVLKATTVGTLIILIDSYLFEIELITPVFICLFWAMSNILGILSRLLIKYLLNRIGSNALSEMTDTLYTKNSRRSQQS
jgi:FlaA1/EpsC-like NDP-sugar epimerase